MDRTTGGLLTYFPPLVATSYRLSIYSPMLADSQRIAAYGSALRQRVTPGSSVIDLGCGTGALSLLALGSGAGRIEAIESSPAIHIAREVARENGLENQINFHEKNSREVMLESKADLLLSDIRGVLPLFGQSLLSLIDARDRLLAPDGQLIPAKDQIWAAPVSCNAWKERVLGPYSQPLAGYSMQTVISRLRQQPYPLGAQSTPLPLLFSAPLLWWEIDYRLLNTTDHEATLSWEITQGGEIDGVAVWFDSELANGVHFSNQPGKSHLIYGWMFFPWTCTVSARIGDQVEMRLRAKLIGEGYIWVWETIFRGHSPESSYHFQQSSFNAESILSSASLQHSGKSLEGSA